MIELELPDPDLLTIGTVGPPGQRTFLFQAGDAAELVTLVLEKQQAASIADLLGQLLVRLEFAPATDWDRGAMELREPVEPRWRVGAIQVGYDPDTQRFVLELEQLVPEEVDDPPEVRVRVTVEQASRLAAHTAEVVTQGRPPCPLCGRPMLPDGEHVCPSTNGHGTLTR